MNERIKQMLACQFTEEEKVAMAQEMAQATCKKTALESSLKQISAQYKAEITAKENIIKMAAQKIHDGYEYREVDCDVDFNVPERGLKTITRGDTGETFVQQMTMQEKDEDRDGDEEL